MQPPRFVAYRTCIPNCEMRFNHSQRFRQFTKQSAGDVGAYVFFRCVRCIHPRIRFRKGCLKMLQARASEDVIVLGNTRPPVHVQSNTRILRCPERRRLKTLQTPSSETDRLPAPSSDDERLMLLEGKCSRSVVKRPAARSIIALCLVLNILHGLSR